jgi:hypothetical protein
MSTRTRFWGFLIMLASAGVAHAASPPHVVITLKTTGPHARERKIALLLPMPGDRQRGEVTVDLTGTGPGRRLRTTVSLEARKDFEGKPLLAYSVKDELLEEVGAGNVHATPLLQVEGGISMTSKDPVVAWEAGPDRVMLEFSGK